MDEPVYYNGIKLFGMENINNQPVKPIISDMGTHRIDTGEFINFIECPTCGYPNLSKIICQYCGQKFLENEAKE